MAKRITCKCCGTTRLVNKTSGYMGVDLQKKRWRARATDNNSKTHHLGYYETEHEASHIYDRFIINNRLLNRALNHPNKKGQIK